MKRPRRFHVLGAGGHGRVVADIVRSAGGGVTGYVDADPEKVGQEIDRQGAVVVSLQDELFEMLGRGTRPAEWDAVALGIGDNRIRHDFSGRFQPEELPTVVHPTATVAATAELGRGTVVCAGAVVNPGARVGDACVINTGAVVEHDCFVGDGTQVAPNATLCGVVTVGPRTMIGAGSTVLETLEVGREACVGAGAVVVADVSDETTVAGVPARALDQSR